MVGNADFRKYALHPHGTDDSQALSRGSLVSESVNSPLPPHRVATSLCTYTTRLPTAAAEQMIKKNKRTKRMRELNFDTSSRK